MHKVTRLTKTKGNWSEREISNIVKNGVEVSSLKIKPDVIVVMSYLLSDKTIAQAIGHSDFTLEVVDYRKRWIIDTTNS